MAKKSTPKESKNTELESIKQALVIALKGGRK